jgi:hypothetical protein
MLRRRSVVSARLTWLGVWAFASGASAQGHEPLQVERQAGAESCPDAVALAGRVSAIRGQSPAGDSRYFVQFAHAGRSFSALLRSAADGSSVRSLESTAADCGPLAQAAAVTLALLFDAEAAAEEPAPEPAEVVPEPASEPPQQEPSPPSAAGAPRPRRMQLGVAIGAGMAQGVLRRWAPTLLGEVAVAIDRLRFGLGAWWIPAHDSKLAPGVIELGLIAGSARVCYLAFSRSWLQVEGCSGFGVGSISAAASGFADSQTKHRLFAALPLELTLGQASDHASWQLSAALLIPFTRHQFGIDGLGLVYDTPALAAMLAVRVGGWISL